MPRAHASSVLGDRRARLGLIVVVVFALLLVSAFTQVVRKVTGPETQTVRAAFVNSQQVRAGDPVRVDGVNVGKVSKVERHGDSTGSLVTMEVEDEGFPLYADASATLAMRSLLGGIFVINLDRGTPSRGPLGSRTIPPERTDGQQELEDIASMMVGGAAEEGLRTMPSELAEAFSDEDLPADTLRELRRVSPDIARGLAAARGRIPGRDLRRLFENTNRTVRALDTPNDDIRSLVSGVAATLGAFAGRSGALRATLRTAPTALRTTVSTLRRLDGTLDRVDPLVDELRDGAEDWAPTFAQLRPTVSAASALLRDAEPPVRSLRPTATSLSRLSRVGGPLLRDIDPALRRLADRVLPYMNEMDEPTQHTPAQMVGPTFSVLGSGASAAHDRNGHMFRFPATTGEAFLFPNSLPCRTQLTDPDKAALLACDTLEQAMKTFSSYDPLAGTPGTDSSARSTP